MSLAVFPLCPLCPLCEPCFLIFGTNERGIAPSREEEALTPRCLQGYRGVTSGLTSEAHGLSRYAFYSCDTPWERLGTPDFSPACLFFFQENPIPCHFSSVFSAPSVRTLVFIAGRLEAGPTKRKSAYAAMATRKKNVRSILVLFLEYTPYLEPHLLLFSPPL